ESVLGGAVLDQLVGDIGGQVHGDGEAETDTPAGLAGGGDRGGDADHLAGGVEQRPTGAAGVDRSIDLDRVGDHLLTAGVVGCGHRTVQCGDEAGSDGGDQPK